MATLVELGGVRLTIGEEVWLAPTAVSGSARGWSESAAAEYQKYRHRYLTTSVVIEGS